jgi:hypothetical protein
VTDATCFLMSVASHLHASSLTAILSCVRRGLRLVALSISVWLGWAARCRIDLAAQRSRRRLAIGNALAAGLMLPCRSKELPR